jgi:ABC-type transporter Mla MlaB component
MSERKQKGERRLWRRIMQELEANGTTSRVQIAHLHMGRHMFQDELRRRTRTLRVDLDVDQVRAACIALLAEHGVDLRGVQITVRFDAPSRRMLFRADPSPDVIEQAKRAVQKRGLFVAPTPEPDKAV